MTTAQMSVYIGKKGTMPVGPASELQVEVWVTDVKERWGVVRYQVRPVAGWGRLWVEKVNFPSSFNQQTGA